MYRKLSLTIATTLSLISPLACSSGAGELSSSTSSATDTQTAESSYVSDAVLGALSAWPGMRGKTWNVTHDNALDQNWLLRTPVQPIWGQSVKTLDVVATCSGTGCDPDFGLQRCSTQSDCTGGGTCAPVAASVKAPGGTPVSMCVGHSDALYDRMYGLITTAKQFVDVTSLQPADGRFEAALRNAITYLSKTGNAVEVRVLTGDFPVQGVVNTKTEIGSLTRDVPASSPIQVAVGAFRSSDVPPSWNHAKIIAVDGHAAIVGGHNLWTQHYLALDPVADISMQLRGSAAGDAHRFANVLWDYTCKNMTALTWLTWSVWANRLQHGSVSDGCLAPYAIPASEGTSSSTVFAVGRLGTGITTDGNQADAARVALMRSAKTTLRMSLQDIGPVKVAGVATNPWPDAEIAAMADDMTRGVDVYVVLSDPGASAGGLSPSQAQYANGWSLAEVAQYIQNYMSTHAGYATGAALHALLCDKLHLAPLRYNATEATWADGVAFANHAKTIEVDAQGFYIGSQNVYPAGLQEFGFIVDDSRAAATWLSTYWNNVWAGSQTAAISGRGAPSCSF